MIDPVQSIRHYIGPQMDRFRNSNPNAIASLVWSGQRDPLQGALRNLSALPPPPPSPLDNEVTRYRYQQIANEFPLRFPRRVTHLVSEYLTPTRRRPELDVSVTQRELTPLHLAAMLCDTTFVQWLLKAGAQPQPSDRWGWTPAHFAALHGADGEPILRMLVAAGADLQITTEQDGTVEDVQAMTRLPPAPTVENVPFPNQDKSIGMRSAQSLFGDTIRFSHNKHTTAVELIEAWAKRPFTQTPREEGPWVTNFRQQYRVWRQQPAGAYVTDQCRDDNNQPLRMGHGTVAARDHVPGDAVCEFGGQRTAQPEAEFGMMDIAGDRVRSLGSLTNDGFPNMVQCSIQDLGGCDRILLFATDRIKKHSSLTLNYNTHSVKSTTHTETYPKAMRAWLSSHPIGTFCRGKKHDIERIIAAPYSSLENQGTWAKLQYILATPTALLALALEGRLDGREFAEFGGWIGKNPFPNSVLLFCFESPLLSYFPTLCPVVSMNPRIGELLRKKTQTYFQDGNVKMFCNVMKNVTAWIVAMKDLPSEHDIDELIATTERARERAEGSDIKTNKPAAVTTPTVSGNAKSRRKKQQKAKKAGATAGSSS